MSAPRPDIDGIFLPDKAVCELCGEPMPAGEEMFKFHGYSGPCQPMRAPRPEGMSELRLAEITARVANLIDRGAHICVDYLPDASSSFNTITCNRCGYSSEIHDIRDLLADHARLRADGATLQEELVSGRAQWQQERDEYRQIVESSETALATLRERVKKLPTPIDYSPEEGSAYCRWCRTRFDCIGDNREFASTPIGQLHPDNGCLWPEVHKEE